MTMLLKRSVAVHAALGLRAGNVTAFTCRGRFQLSLDSSAFVSVTGAAKNVLGVPLLATATAATDVTVLSIGKGGSLVLGGATIGRGVSLFVGKGASLAIGAGSYVTNGSRIIASLSISIGERCAISWGVTIIDDDGHGRGKGPFHAPVEIHDHVWVGCNVTILKGVTIGAGSIVGAGSVVTRSCAPCSLMAGNPARVVKSDVSW
jgi:carbonic anhydrase/acetyltransferase-like protein (isoleucine patch superfamily)